MSETIYEVTKIDEEFTGWYNPGEADAKVIGGIILTLQSVAGEEDVRFNCKQNFESCPVFNKGMQSCEADNIRTTQNGRDIQRPPSMVTCGHIQDFQPHLKSISIQAKKLKEE